MQEEKDTSSAKTEKLEMLNNSEEKTVAEKDENCDSDSAEMKEDTDKNDAATLADVQQELKDLKYQFDEKILNDEHQNKLFDDLHAEVVQYRNGALDKIVDNMALDIIQTIDNGLKTAAKFEKREPSEDNYKRLLRQFNGFIQDMSDILYRQSIEPYSVPGHDVDIKKQKIIGTVPTDNPERDNRIAFRCGAGYEEKGRILRAERIKIFKYEPAEEKAEEPKKEDK